MIGTTAKEQSAVSNQRSAHSPRLRRGMKGADFAIPRSAAGALAVWLLGMLVLAGCTRSESAAPAASVPAPSSQASDLPSDDELLRMLDEELLWTYQNRQLNLTEHAAWQIMHGALTYGKRFKVNNGDQPVGAVDWVLAGNDMKGWTLRHGTPNLAGERQGLKAVLESGTKEGQGHEDQWLAILSQAGLSSEQPIEFRGKTYTIGDMVLQAMHDVYDGKECSWTVISFSRYLPPGHAWKNSRGEDWNLQRIVAMEAAQDVDNSACGGTHRLIGMSMALRQHLADGGRLEDGWQAAHEKIQQAMKIARQYQQPDGSFSTNYFARPSHSADVALQINTTGHTLEFITLAAEDQRLAEPWVTRAVVRLCELFHQTRQIPLECGSLYHAAHGLILYRERRFGPFPYPEDAKPEATPEQSPGKEPKAEPPAAGARTTPS